MIPGLGGSSGEGNDNPLQYSCLENSMDRRAWRSTVYGIAKSRMDTRTNTFTFKRKQSKTNIDNKQTPFLLFFRRKLYQNIRVAGSVGGGGNEKEKILGLESKSLNLSLGQMNKRSYLS